MPRFDYFEECFGDVDRLGIMLPPSFLNRRSSVTTSIATSCNSVPPFPMPSPPNSLRSRITVMFIETALQVIDGG